MDDLGVPPFTETPKTVKATRKKQIETLLLKDVSNLGAAKGSIGAEFWQLGHRTKTTEAHGSRSIVVEPSEAPQQPMYQFGLKFSSQTCLESTLQKVEYVALWPCLFALSLTNDVGPRRFSANCASDQALTIGEAGPRRDKVSIRCHLGTHHQHLRRKEQ